MTQIAPDAPIIDGQPNPIMVGEVDHRTERPDWMGSWSFITVHLACVLVFWAGFSWTALGVALVTYAVRAFGLTGGYHRYFSHRTYKTSRWFQFVIAYIGTSAAQMGPLWWAAHHRHHHRHSDTDQDVHSPVAHGFFWSHVGWILSRKYMETNTAAIPDFAKYPELRFIDNYHVIPPITLALGLYGLGWVLEIYAPGLGTNGFQMLVWAFFISTVCLYHATFFVNSLTHVHGTRRFETEDHSRNNWIVAITTLGEGWHNNHHRWPHAEAQGMYWWEFDPTHYTIKVLSWLGLVWDIKTHPKSLYDEAQQDGKAPLPGGA
jgi:stearoyl-CoA desaturase (delta-9 desaturase)